MNDRNWEDTLDKIISALHESTNVILSQLDAFFVCVWIPRIVGISN